MECCLARGELLRLDGGETGVVLRCMSGTVWLTCGDGRDYLLPAGKSFTVGVRQWVVAEALQKAEWRVEKPLSARPVMQNRTIRLAAC